MIEGTATVGVLIVDDQAPFRAVARTVVAALPRLRRRRRGRVRRGSRRRGRPSAHPQLVLMDINLPGINGIEATRRITADAARTPS